MNSKNSFARNVFIVSMGPIISSLVSFLAEPWIARFWDPAKFGTVSYFNSVLLMISPLMFLRYNFAIVQGENERERHSLLALSFFIQLSVLVLIWILYPYVIPLVSKEFPFADYAWLFFPTLMFAGFYSLLRFWASSSKQFVSLTVSTIILQSSNTVLLLIFGALGMNSTQNALFIRSASFFLAPLLMIGYYLRHELKQTLKLVNLASMRAVLVKYKRYPLFDFWGTWAATIAFYIPTIFIARFWGQETNGLYSKAFSIVYLLVLFIGDAVNRVFHKEIADIVNSDGKLAPFVMNVISTLSKISILPFVMLILAGPELFALVLGGNWLDSGYYARAISMWMYSILISSAITPLYGVLNRQLQHTLFSLAGIVVRILIFILCSKLGASALTTVATFSMAGFVLIAFQFSFIVKIAGVSLRKLAWMLMKPVLQLLPMVAVFFGVKILFKPSAIFTLGMAAVLALPYLYIFYLKEESVRGLLNSLVKPDKFTFFQKKA